MNILFRWYNQNRKMIWIVVLSIIAVIALIQTLNSYYKNKTNEEGSSANNSTTTYNTSNYSVVSQKEINSTLSENSISIIEKFFDYCNNNQIEEAYSLLSEDCKEELYSSIDEFKTKYFDLIFTEAKSYNSTLWISNTNKNTYRLEIYADILATGKKDEMPIEDYYTVVYDNGNYTLNISNYIGKEDINVSTSEFGFEITVISKQIYMEYENYLIRIKNNSTETVVLNTKQDTNSMYLEDENSVKYIAFLNEISDYDLNIQSGYTKEINIKFNRIYKPNIKINKIIFDNIKIEQDDELRKVEIDI